MREYIIYAILIFIPIGFLMSYLLRKEGLDIKYRLVIISASLAIIMSFPILMTNMGLPIALLLYVLALAGLTLYFIKATQSQAWYLRQAGAPASDEVFVSDRFIDMTKIQTVGDFEDAMWPQVTDHLYMDAKKEMSDINTGIYEDNLKENKENNSISTAAEELTENKPLSKTINYTQTIQPEDSEPTEDTVEADSLVVNQLEPVLEHVNQEELSENEAEVAESLYLANEEVLGFDRIGNDEEEISVQTIQPEDSKPTENTVEADSLVVNQLEPVLEHVNQEELSENEAEVAESLYLANEEVLGFDRISNDEEEISVQTIQPEDSDPTEDTVEADSLVVNQLEPALEFVDQEELSENEAEVAESLYLANEEVLGFDRIGNDEEEISVQTIQPEDSKPTENTVEADSLVVNQLEPALEFVSQEELSENEAMIAESLYLDNEEVLRFDGIDEEQENIEANSLTGQLIEDAQATLDSRSSSLNTAMEVNDIVAPAIEKDIANLIDPESISREEILSDESQEDVRSLRHEDEPGLANIAFDRPSRDAIDESSEVVLDNLSQFKPLLSELPQESHNYVGDADSTQVDDKINQLIDHGFSLKNDQCLMEAVNYFESALDLSVDPDLCYLLLMEIVNIYKDNGMYAHAEEVLFRSIGKSHMRTDIMYEIERQLSYIRFLSVELNRLGLANTPIAEVPRWVRMNVAEILEA